MKLFVLSGRRDENKRTLLYTCDCFFKASRFKREVGTVNFAVIRDLPNKVDMGFIVSSDTVLISIGWKLI